MFGFIRKKRISKYTNHASEYLDQLFTPEVPKNDSIIRYSLRNYDDDSDEQKKKTPTSNPETNIRYSERDTSDTSVVLEDKYDSSAVATLMKKYNLSTVSENLTKDLDRITNKTFVDALIVHISKKGMKDSEVYKAAQIDRRLFSKIMSNRQYKPAKDTAIAIAIALRLSLDEANDLLSRAGFTLSHSNKKDIIIEYFFCEQIYQLDDINQVLFNLGQKPIGR